MTTHGRISLGFVANGKRSINPGKEYDRYFDLTTVKGEESELMANGTVYDTLKQMQKIVRDTLPQTERIATKLQGSTRETTCKNIFNFLYQHVQYKKDNPLREQLRTPARTWKDRSSGVDCDCYSIFISSVLTNLKIPHAFRMAGYKGDYQHVYVVVPKSGSAYTGGYYTIDPVVDQFNYETPFTKKHDHGMNKVTMLDGVGQCSPTKPVRRFVFTDEVSDYNLVPTKQFLQENNIGYEEIIDPVTGGGVLLVTTKNGVVQVPTIITIPQSQQLLSVSGVAPSTITTTPAPTEEKKKFWWGWLAIAGGALVLLTGSDQEEVKPGLNGVPAAKKKISKPTPLKVIHI
jgi:hypothetical protein